MSMIVYDTFRFLSMSNAAWRQEGILRRDVRPDDTWNRCCIRF